MPYRIMCNGVSREGVKARSDLVYRLFFIYHYTNFDMVSHDFWAYIFVFEQTFRGIFQKHAVQQPIQQRRRTSAKEITRNEQKTEVSSTR